MTDPTKMTHHSINTFFATKKVLVGKKVLNNDFK